MATGLDQAQICACFNALFEARYRVQLRGGGAEPDYFPPTESAPGALVAREDFATSALHEAAHWCVAGAARRALPDYGYVYLPPPRSAIDQQLFFSSELRNQAVELYLAVSAGVAFRASADDPDLGFSDLAAFELEVRALVAQWQGPALLQRHSAPPQRAVLLGAALSAALLAERTAKSGAPGG